MSKSLQSIRGMNDILPNDTALWQRAEKAISKTLQSYNYHEIRFPILESTALFKRSVGEATDIVEKEMYTFEDRNGESMSMRPEGTASCVRAGIQNGLLHNQIQRLWYTGPFFRYERPQKGRYRQFYQLGVELFGLAGADADLEMILISKRILDNLGLTKHIALELNTLGTPESRTQYRDQLVQYFKQHLDQLDEDSLRRLETNPLRILDSKNPAMQALIAAAPKLTDHLDEVSTTHFNTLKSLLDHLGINYTVNPTLVRGLDYYCHTVFEWTTNLLGAQSTVCAGGRYDGLVEQLGGKATPATGFAMGLERAIELAKTTGAFEEADLSPDIYFISIEGQTQEPAALLCEQLRDQLSDIKIVSQAGSNIGKQIKKADKSGAKFALIYGEEEHKNQTITLKHLRESKPQQDIALADLATELQKFFGK